MGIKSRQAVRMQSLWSQRGRAPRPAHILCFARQSRGLRVQLFTELWFNTGIDWRVRATKGKQLEIKSGRREHKPPGRAPRGGTEKEALDPFHS